MLALWLNHFNSLATAESQLRSILRTAEFCVNVYFWESILK